MLLNDLANICHQNAVKKGFYSTIETIKKSFVSDDLGEQLRAETLAQIGLSRLMLITTEVAECAEGIRKPGKSEHCPELTKVEEEVADILIRLFDFAGYMKIDLDRAVEVKMAYNAKRTNMHGGKLA